MLTKNDYDDDGDDYKEEKNLTKREGLDKHGENSKQQCYNCKKNILFILYSCLRSQEGIHRRK